MDPTTSPSSSNEGAPPAPGRLFHVKAALGGAGLLLGLVGMSLHRMGLVWGAAGCLAVAFLLRFARRP